MCVCVSLTGRHGLRAVDVVVQAEERRHAGGRAQALGQVGGSWVVGVHAVLGGHVVAGQASLSVRHLLHTRPHGTQKKKRETFASTCELM